MASNRRDFLKRAALAGAGAAFYQTVGKGRAWAFAQSPTNIRKFVTSLPGLGPSAKNEIGQYIPLATKRTIKFAGKPTDVYNLAVAQFSQLMHPDLPGKTDFFGYTDARRLTAISGRSDRSQARARQCLLNVANQLPTNIFCLSIRP